MQNPSYIPQYTYMRPPGVPSEQVAPSFLPESSQLPPLGETLPVAPPVMLPTQILQPPTFHPTVIRQLPVQQPSFQQPPFQQPYQPENLSVLQPPLFPQQQPSQTIHLPVLQPVSLSQPPAFQQQSFVQPPAFQQQSFVQPPAFQQQSFVQPPAFQQQSFIQPPSFAQQPAYLRQSFVQEPSFFRQPQEYTSRQPQEYTPRQTQEYTPRQPQEYTPRQPQEYTVRQSQEQVRLPQSHIVETQAQPPRFSQQPPSQQPSSQQPPYQRKQYEIRRSQEVQREEMPTCVSTSTTTPVSPVSIASPSTCVPCGINAKLAGVKNMFLFLADADVNDSNPYGSLMVIDPKFTFLRSFIGNNEQLIQQEVNTALTYFDEVFGINLSQAQEINGKLRRGPVEFFGYYLNPKLNLVAINNNESCCVSEGGFVIYVIEPGVSSYGTYSPKGEYLAPGTQLYFGYYIIKSQYGQYIIHFRSIAPTRPDESGYMPIKRKVYIGSDVGVSEGVVHGSSSVSGPSMSNTSCSPVSKSTTNNKSHLSIKNVILI